jgi:hypothetical protein
VVAAPDIIVVQSVSPAAAATHVLSRRPVIALHERGHSLRQVIVSIAFRGTNLAARCPFNFIEKLNERKKIWRGYAKRGIFYPPIQFMKKIEGPDTT